MGKSTISMAIFKFATVSLPGRVTQETTLSVGIFVGLLAK
jgi:hypothetical protein